MRWHDRVRPDVASDGLVRFGGAGLGMAVSGRDRHDRASDGGA